MSIDITAEAILEEARNLAQQNTDLRIQLRSVLAENEKLRDVVRSMEIPPIPLEDEGAPVALNRATRRAKKTT